MAAKLIRLTHKIEIQLHLVAKSSIICSPRSRRAVLKLLDTPSYAELVFIVYMSSDVLKTRVTLIEAAKEQRYVIRFSLFQCVKTGDIYGRMASIWH
jgi:hypothetical protein